MFDKDYKNICLQCHEIVKKTGVFIKTELGKVKKEEIEIKSLNSLVSYVDKTAEIQLVEELGRLIPEAGFITEEGTVAQGGKDLQWIIDPLDGTNNFLNSIPHFAISVALRDLDELVVGIILEVNSGEMFYAWKGGGAFLNGQPIHVSKVKELSNSVIATGFPYNAEHIDPIIKSLEHFIKYARGVRRFGAAALDMAYVACGRFESYYESTLNAWDVAAGALIVKEAGGRVSDFNFGQQYLADGNIIASNPYIHKNIQEIIHSKFGV